jgi:hypothetical protein
VECVSQLGGELSRFGVDQRLSVRDDPNIIARIRSCATSANPANLLLVRLLFLWPARTMVCFTIFALGVTLLATFTKTAYAQFVPNARFQRDATVGACVRTSSGLIEGHAASRPGVSEYLGIPYAFSPTGDLRFAPPVQYHGDGTVRANAYVCCVQQISRVQAMTDHS